MRGPGRNLLISLLVVLCSTEASVKKRDVDGRRVGLVRFMVVVGLEEEEEEEEEERRREKAVPLVEPSF